MARTLVVKTIFRAADQATKPMNNISKRFQGLGKSISKATGGLGRVMKGVLGAHMIMAGINAIRRGIGSVINEFKEFDHAIIAAGAKFGTAFKKGTKGAELLRKVTRDIGAKKEFSANQAAQGLDFLAMAGFDAEQAMSMLPGVVDLATSTNMDLARSTDIASDALGAFNLMTKDSAQLQTNLNRVMDVMSKTTVTANTNMEDLFEAVKKGAPTFTNAGQSMETFNTMAGVMANAGIKGSEAGTALRNIMLRLAKPTGEAAATLKRLKVETRDGNGNFRDAVDILNDVNKGLAGMGTAQKTAALSTIFGARAVTSVNVLLNEGTDSLKSYRKELENSTGSTKELAEEMRKSLKNSLEKIKSGLIETGFKAFDVFGKAIEKAVNHISKFVDRMNDFLETNKEIIGQKVEKVFAFIAKVFERMQPTIRVIVDLIKNIVERIQALGKNTTVIEILKIVFESIMHTVQRIVGIITMFVDTIASIGEKLGILEMFKNLMISVRLLWENVLDAVQSFWKTISDTGALELVMNIFKLIGNYLGYVFRILGPIIKLNVFFFKILMSALSPIIKMVNLLVSGLNLLFGALNKIGNKKYKASVDVGVGGDDSPKSSNARSYNAGIDSKQTITNIDKAMLEIKGTNIPAGIDFEKSGDWSKNIVFDLGQNK